MKKNIITLVSEKTPNFFAENCQKSKKIAIITSTPGKYLFSHEETLLTKQLDM
jgi:hypothetical protein